MSCSFWASQVLLSFSTEQQGPLSECFSVIPAQTRALLQVCQQQPFHMLGSLGSRSTSGFKLLGKREKISL